MKPSCDYCDKPSSERFLIFAKGVDPSSILPALRLASAVGLVCETCKRFLTAHPDKAGIPRSCRAKALDEFVWGPTRAVVAAQPHPSLSDDELFGPSVMPSGEAPDVPGVGRSVAPSSDTLPKNRLVGPGGSNLEAHGSEAMRGERR